MALSSGICRANAGGTLVTRGQDAGLSHQLVSEGQTCDVSGSEEELRLVVGEEGCMPPAFLLVQGVDLALKLGVRLDGARLASHL